MSKISDRIYARAPIWVQNLGVTAFGAYWRWLRFGPGFRPAVEEFASRERFTTAQWAQWTDSRLRGFLSVAAERVPYYRAHWSAEAKQAARAGRLGDLPLLSKTAVRSDPWSFVRDDMPRERMYTFHTSGSTGTPIASIWQRTEIRRSLAIREIRSAGWAGISFSAPRATFSGRMVVPDPDSNGPFHRFNASEQQVYLSAFHLRSGTTKTYLEALHHHGTQWITGYAFSIYQLAKFAREQNLNAPQLKAVVTTSEKVTPEMRKVIGGTFGCRVFEEYSTVENAVFASECEHGRLHVSPDAGVLEVLRPDGHPCLPGEVGEVVATCLLRDAQPLIRYRLGDMAAWDPNSCPCGRSMPVLQELVGRVEDVIRTPDGRQLVRFHGLFVNQPNVIEAQVIQEKLDSIRVRIVPTPAFGENDRLEVISRLHARIGSGISVQIELVPSIPRSKSGKYRAVISLLDPSTDAAQA